MNDDIISNLLSMRDEKFAQLNRKIIPNINGKNIIGVKTPSLRKYAKTIPNVNLFLDKLPHNYFEENQIHAFILSDIRDFETCINMVDKFLPYIDNWATCDQLIPKTFAKKLNKTSPP